MALNEIKVPDWAWRPMERDSWIVLSHVWAGRSVGQEQVSACAGVWLLSGQTFLNTLLPNCRPPTAALLYFIYTQPGNAGLTTHLQQVWTLLNLQIRNFGELQEVSHLYDLCKLRGEKRQYNLCCSGCIILLDDGEIPDAVTYKHKDSHVRAHTHTCTGVADQIL